MAQIERPPRFHQKVLAQEAPGSTPAAVDVVVPSVLEPGQLFNVRLAVLDALGYPSLLCNGPVLLRHEHMVPAEVSVDFQTGVPATAEVRDVALREPGFHRLTATLGDLSSHSNPTRCEPGPHQRILWGDPHVHTVLSRCHPDLCRSMNFCFTAARYGTGLDWVSAADHVSNGRCDFSKWKEQSTVADLYDTPGQFVTLPAYEASLKGGCGGDINVYMARFPDMFVDEYEQGDARTLCEKLCERIPSSEFFVVPHHTTRTGKHGEVPDAIYPGAALMPVVEIHSKWGTSEYRGNPNPLRKVHDGPSSVQDLLARGLKLGFVAGTDTHATMPSGYGKEPDHGHLWALPGFTAVRADELTRGAIFQGIGSRACYAASGERVYLDVTVDGAAGGTTLLASPGARPTISAVVAAKTDIARVDVVRNNVDIHTVAPREWHTSFVLTDGADLSRVALESPHLGRFVAYYVRVTCTSGAQAWSSPVWIVL